MELGRHECWNLIGYTMACVAFLSGCRSLEGISAGHVGCPESEVEISDYEKGWTYSTWIATCHGMRYQCSQYGSGDDLDVSCTPDKSKANTVGVRSTSGGNVAANRTRPSNAPADNVRRIVRTSGNKRQVLMKAWLNPDPFAIGVLGSARKTGIHKVATRYAAPPGRHKQCSLRVMINGDMTELERAAYRRSGRHEEVVSRVPTDLMKKMATAQRVVGRVCSDQFRIDEDDQRILNEYLTRLADEQAWVGDEASARNEADAGGRGGNAGTPTDGGMQKSPDGEAGTSPADAGAKKARHP